VVISIISVVIFSASFFITKDLFKISEIVNEKKIDKHVELMTNPIKDPSHAAHFAVRKFYLGKKSNDDWSDKNAEFLKINERKMARLKDKLSDNFLLKRSSDMILIIVAATVISLLLSKKGDNKNNELV